MRIGIDAMGGDRAPGVVVQGALDARSLLGESDRIVLVGQRDAVMRHLDQVDDWDRIIEIHHADDVIGMDEPPVDALRNKPGSSIAILAQIHAEGKIDACISAGNTGAFVAAAQMRLRRLRGVHRPGIVVLAPTLHGPLALCDVGANVNCRPVHLHQYAVMASVYLKTNRNISAPRVALLSIGEEDAKGNDLVKQARELMKEDPTLNFIGNLEGRDLFRGVSDVLVCEGFVGNVVLKMIEGMVGGVLLVILERLMDVIPDKKTQIGEFSSALAGMYDFNEYGAAPLLGVGGSCLICHGATEARGIKNAVSSAISLIQKQVNKQIVDLLARNKRTIHA